MVIINELRVTPDGKSLIIDASVENLSYYKNVNIAAVIVDTQDTFVPSGPSNNALYHNSYESDDMVVSVIDDCQSVKTEDSCPCNGIITSQKAGVKHIRTILTEKDLGVPVDNNIFFVYIVCNGTPAPDTPCGMDNIYTMGVTYHKLPIYNMGMNYVREMSSTCDIPRGFIDYILRLKAFELSMKTGNYQEAFKYWNSFFKNRSGSVTKSRRCGCHGNY